MGDPRLLVAGYVPGRGPAAESVREERARPATSPVAPTIAKAKVGRKPTHKLETYVAAWERWYAKHGRPPSIEQLARVIGVGWGAVQRHLKTAREQGMLTAHREDAPKEVA